ncbi:cation:proton antiporter [Anaerosalibacter massiliensis]|uniref:Cation:proton antiporter n=1 Tax=Anaerosalibacter massiliensis TaxID=1347392 RepID=A0A9X2MJA4_9FIRM|nr:cation:proton antiporter [Anaerosalibacter massiliensis]MCR2044558.1 cation:proton antiporter [Anaerosalibacter massiliensis]
MNIQFNNLNDVTIILICLSIMLFSGFLVTRITKMLKLPNVTGYIVAGILIGPYVLNIIPAIAAENMGFVGDIALAFIAFDVGKFLRKEIFQSTGTKVIVITLFESLFTGFVVTISMHFVFKLDWNFSLLLGAISTATAPASTMMTINQYKAHGKFVNTLLQVIALDDVVCLIVFSVIIAIINANETGVILFDTVILPIMLNIAALGIGFLSGMILDRLLIPNRSDDNRLILTIALLFGISGLCSAFDISPLLSCMVFGATYINTTQDKRLYKQINNFTPPILSLFFIISGVRLDIGALSTLGIVGVSYFLIRIIGKYIGAFLGCYVTNMDETISNYLGLALIPQAGVSIGLAFLGQRILPVDIGNQMMTIILASSVLYELIGPASAKVALALSGAIEEDKIKTSKEKERYLQVYKRI